MSNHWYAIDNSGMATLCVDEHDARESAKEYAEIYPKRAPYVVGQLCQPAMPAEISRDLLGGIVDQVFGGAIEDTTVIEDIYRVIACEYRGAMPADAEIAEWMTCESRRPWVTNSLKTRATALRDAEKRCRGAFKEDYMGEPARYVADAYGEAAAVIETKLDAIDHARRRIEGES